jgi:AcrR family transcriptional regulator
VSPNQVPALREPDSVSPRPAQARVIDAALKLFGEHGVGGTSLQMIAEEIGVTKAAVYHQYNTKVEIIRAVAEAELDRLEAVLSVAETEPDLAKRLDAVLVGIVDLAVERRRQVSTLLNDPVIGQLYAQDARLLGVLNRLHRLIMGPGTRPESMVATAMLTAAISGAVIHPLVAGQQDAVLRAQLLRLARRFLELPTG